MITILELLDDGGKCGDLLLIWVHGVPLYIFADDLVLIEGRGHEIVFGNVVPVIVLILTCIDVAHKFSVRGDLV